MRTLPPPKAVELPSCATPAKISNWPVNVLLPESSAVPEPVFMKP